MRLRRLVAGSGLLLASGCADRAMERGLDAHLGRPVQALVERLGPPDAQAGAGGQRVFSWTHEAHKTRTIEEPYTTMAFQPQTGRYEMVNATRPREVAYTERCRVGVVVDARGDVARWDHEGDGCGFYAARLRGTAGEAGGAPAPAPRSSAAPR